MLPTPLQDQPTPEPSWPPPHWAPPLSVLMLTLATVLMGVIIGGGLTLVMAKMTGFDLAVVMGEIADHNTPERRNLLRGANLLSHVFTFSVAPIAVAIFIFRRQWAEHLGLWPAPDWKKLAYATVFMLFTMPWVQLTYWLNKQIPLPQWMGAMEERTGGLIQSLLVMDSPGELIFTLVVIALAPALGEELLFRGTVQQQLSRWWGKPVWAVWITAVLFSLIHFQFAGFLPRMLLGAGLGYLFLWTRSLWAPIAGHFAINAVQVLAMYFVNIDLESAEEKINFYTLVLPCLLVLPVLYLLVKLIRRPGNLPPDFPGRDYADNKTA